MKRAFKDVKDLKVAFNLPGPDSKAKASEQAAKRAEAATRFWQVGQYMNFGLETGGLMRDLLLGMLPMQANSLAAPPTLYEVVHLDDANATPGFFALYLGGFAAVTLLGLALVRIKSKFEAKHHHNLLQDEPEEAHDMEAMAIE